MSQYKMLVVDFDGTLLTSQKKLSGHTLNE